MMKAIKLIAIGIILFATNVIHSQISVNVNIGSPPAWGPVGYSNVDYYYLPDVEAYYDIRASQFIYFGGGNWIRATYLPGRYRNYDLYNGYKVVLTDYHGPRPYTYYKSHKAKYYKGYRGAPQRAIGGRHDNGNHENHDNQGNHDNNGGHHKGGKGKH